jgi:N-acetylmuramoyl-L-alanine amidase
LAPLPKLFPLVQQIITPTLYSRASFGPGGPSGVTVHYTADASVEDAIKSFAANGYAYHLVIDRDGKVTQTAYMDRGTWHAGKAVWNGKSPNRAHIAVAVASWGKLEPDGQGGWQSWAKTPIDPAEVAQRPDNLDGTLAFWHACTAQQEAALLEVLRWAVAGGISPADMCDHSECALPRGRKEDVGGALSMTMAQLRAAIQTGDAPT